MLLDFDYEEDLLWVHVRAALGGYTNEMGKGRKLYESGKNYIRTCGSCYR
jgi:hypothetical protein